ncbi:MAG: D-aminoacyl-tRNA deacylase [Candidatus Nanopelagicales bacterium]
MRALVQRASGASVRVAGQVVGGFTGPGLCVLVGVTHTDTELTARRCADKVYDLRIFDSERFQSERVAGCAPPGSFPARELSAAELALPVLVVSQFTLYGDTRKGRRPSWEQAAGRTLAEPLVATFGERLSERGAPLHTGVFGAHMDLSLTNDGPVTLLVEVT